MQPTAEESPRAYDLARAIRTGWQPLVLFESLMSLLFALLLGPLLVALSYPLLGLSGDDVLGNWDLIRLLLTPRGAGALVAGGAALGGLIFVEYAGLILLSDAALRGTRLSARQLLSGLGSSAGRMFSLAAFCTGLLAVVAIPFALLAAAVYFFLLADADINYYLAERPPRLWVAVGIGLALAAGFAVFTVWLFARWAFAVPICALGRQSWLAALRSSARLMHGRVRRLLLVVGSWQLLKIGAFAALGAALDRMNGMAIDRAATSLTLLWWTTVAVMLVDAVLWQVMAGGFAIGLALLVAGEFERARRAQGMLEPESGAYETWRGAAGGSGWPSRVALAAILLLVPAWSIRYSLWWADEFIERRPVLVTAHRAGPKTAPENSRAALRLALEAGADLVEIDVQLTADGHVVLMHDRDLRRMTGDARDVNLVNLADLQGLRLRHAGQPTDARVPTLPEFLAACDDRIRLNVELKDFGRTPGLAAAVVDELRGRGFAERAVVSCLELAPLVEVRRLDPTIPVGIILSTVKGDMTRLPVEFLSLNQRLVRLPVVRRAHQRGLEVHVWTVDSRESALRVLDLGCDNLITGDPLLAREVVDWYTGLNDAEHLLFRLRRLLRR